MIYIQVLPLLLLLVCPLYIKGDGEKCKDEQSEKSIEKLLTMVSAQSEMIKEQGEKIQDQDQNIRDLHKSLDKRLRENDLKIEWALTDGTLAPQNTSSIMQKIDEAVQMLRQVNESTYKPGSCAEIDSGRAQGVHSIFPYGTTPVRVTCESSTDGGWTVIQKRFDGSVDFFRGLEEYAEGFGNPAGEYWLGLQHINALTSAQPMELYVGMTDFDDVWRHASYSYFHVSSEGDKFRLQIGNYSGNAGDNLKYDKGQQFSTKDQDNDKVSAHCSNRYQGAWWYSRCYNSHLNGIFTKVQANDHKYIWWSRWIKSSVMMIRPSNFRP